MLAAAPLYSQNAPGAEGEIPDGFWLRRYTVQTYGHQWHLALTVKDVAKTREKAVDILQKEKGVSTLPLDNMAGGDATPYAQLSFKMSRKDAEKALPKLKKLGQVERLIQREALEPKMDEEIKIKIDRLKAEKKSGGEILNRLTATAALQDELILTLEKTLADEKAARDRVLFNVVLETGTK